MVFDADKLKKKKDYNERIEKSKQEVKEITKKAGEEALFKLKGANLNIGIISHVQELQNAMPDASGIAEVE